jgi:hypothetical protein
MYMSIVAVAILISFHLKAEASALEKRIALPFGLVFWVLAIACLAAGLNNYIKTVSRYSRRQALVQSGTGTQLVSGIVVAMRDAGSPLLPKNNADIALMPGLYRCGDSDCCRLCTFPVDECSKQQFTLEFAVRLHTSECTKELIIWLKSLQALQCGSTSISISSFGALRSSLSSSAPPS